MKLAIKQLSRG